jgi:hypothetical protein
MVRDPLSVDAIAAQQDTPARHSFFERVTKRTTPCQLVMMHNHYDLSPVMNQAAPPLTMLSARCDRRRIRRAQQKSRVRAAAFSNG